MVAQGEQPSKPTNDNTMGKGKRDAGKRAGVSRVCVNRSKLVGCWFVPLYGVVALACCRQGVMSVSVRSLTGSRHTQGIGKGIGSEYGDGR